MAGVTTRPGSGCEPRGLGVVLGNWCAPAVARLMLTPEDDAEDVRHDLVLRMENWSAAHTSLNVHGAVWGMCMALTGIPGMLLLIGFGRFATILEWISYVLLWVGSFCIAHGFVMGIRVYVAYTRLKRHHSQSLGAFAQRLLCPTWVDTFVLGPLTIVVLVGISNQ